MNGLRLIDSDIGPVVPIKDIIKQIGYSRSGATRVIQRHGKSFAGLTAVVSIKTPAGTRRVKCLSKPGIEEFIKHLMPDPVLYPDLAVRVNEFKIRALGLPLEPAPALPVPQENDIVTILTAAADIADVLKKRWNYPEDVALRLAMKDAMNKHPGVLDPFKGPIINGDEKAAPLALPPPAETSQCCKECVMAERDPDYDRTFGIKHVAQLCGLKSDYNKAQRILEKQEILTYANGSYHLTRLGETIGAGKVFTMYRETPHRLHPEKVIRYFPLAIERIKTAMSAGQAQFENGELVSPGIDRALSSVPRTTAIEGHSG